MRFIAQVCALCRCAGGIRDFSRVRIQALTRLKSRLPFQAGTLAVFSYADAHRYRLGTHYEALPVNAPKCRVHHYDKDGAMRFFRNDTGNPDAYYEPNSFGGPKQDPAVAEPPLHISGDAARYDHHEGNDDFSQPGALFRLFDADQKKRLFSNIAAAMQGVPEPVQSLR